MKKTAIVLFVLVIAFSYSCKKEGKEVSTTISGQIRTNGTEDPIRLNNELDNPVIDIYHVIDQVGYTSSGYERIASTSVDDKGHFLITLDLNSEGDYFWGVSKIDETTYNSSNTPSLWWDIFYSTYHNRITPGETNNKIIYMGATSWVQHRLINSNPDPNNSDVFDCPTWGISLYGSIDSIMPWVHKTWSGTYSYAINDNNQAHQVKAKLTRNGITRDTSIIYTVPPFDTTVVEIRY